MRYGGGKRRSLSLKPLFVLCVVVTGLGLLVLSLRPLDAPASSTVPLSRASSSEFNTFSNNGSRVESILAVRHVGERPCKTVEEMGEDFTSGVGKKESLRVRRMIQNHFLANGTFAFLYFDLYFRLSAMLNKCFFICRNPRDCQ